MSASELFAREAALVGAGEAFDGEGAGPFGARVAPGVPAVRHGPAPDIPGSWSVVRGPRTRRPAAHPPPRTPPNDLRWPASPCAATVPRMSDAPLAPLFEPPYWVVVFTSVRTDGDDGYGDMAAEMVRLAAEQPGYLGFESVRAADGVGITASYWRHESDARAWKQIARHLDAQRRGREHWYRAYRVRVARVEREYGFDAEGGA